VRTAASGCDVVHISVGGPDERSATEQAAHAAADVGAERLGYVSGTTVSEDHRWFPMIEAKLAGEAAVRAAGVPWTIFRPSWPFEQLPRFAHGGRPFLLGELSPRWHWFAADDMARMVSTAYRKTEAEGKRLTIHGPEAMSLREALQRYCDAVHPDAPPIQVMRLWLARAVGVLSRNAQLRFAAALMSYFAKVGEGGDPTDTNRLVGAPDTTLDEWLAVSAASSRTDPRETGSAV
jgi:nucleoside-diphosphate-sugar epimerase